MRTNRNGVTEVAHIRTNLAKYAEEWERIYGKKDLPPEASTSDEPHCESSPEISIPDLGSDLAPESDA